MTFLPYPPHLHRAVPDDRGLRTPTLPRPTARCLTCDSCASGQNVAFSFLQIPPHAGHPCCSARSSCHQGLQGTCPLTSHFPVGVRLPVDSARQGAARHAWRTSGRPGSLLTLAPHRSGRAGSAASGSSTDSFATRRRVPAGPGSQALATAIPQACLASSAIRCRDVETGPTLGVLAVFPSTGATCRCPLPSTGSRGLHAPASAVSGRRRRPSKGSPPSAAQTVRAVFPHTAFTRLPGGREMEGINEWTFCSPVGLSQSASLLGRSLLGLSHKATYPRHRPDSLPSCRLSHHLADRLPQPTRLPLSRSNGFHRPSGTIRSSDSSHDIAFHCPRRQTSRSAYLGWA